MLEKFKYPYSTGCLTEKPIRSFFYIFIIIISDFFKIKFKYKNNFFNSKFIFNYKPYTQRGLGGRGQFILREYYDRFFFIGHKILPKKFNFVDVGCSRGYFSLYLLGLQNFKGKGLCIDPLSNAIRDFQEILSLNKKQTISYVNGVISNQNKRKLPIFKVSKEGFYSIIKNVSFAEKKMTNNLNERFFVPSYTLDNLILKKKKITNIKFIKIDSEGAEYEILSAAKKSIKKFKPIIYCEVTRKKKEIYNFLRKKNYILFTFDRRKLVEISLKKFANGEVLAIHKNDSYFSRTQ
tara:strand:+ start:798 stop:1676 length:879 start_codon:yes stop_codon:yes gene_type:complete